MTTDDGFRAFRGLLLAVALGSILWGLVLVLTVMLWP